MPPRKTMSGELIDELHKLKAKYKWDWKTIARKMGHSEQACKRSWSLWYPSANGPVDLTNDSDDDSEDSDMEVEQQLAGRLVKGEPDGDDVEIQEIKPPAAPAKRAKGKDKMIANLKARVLALEDELRTERANAGGDRQRAAAALEAAHNAHHEREKEVTDKAFALLGEVGRKVPKPKSRKTISGPLIGRLHDLKKVYKHNWSKISQTMEMPEAACMTAWDRWYPSSAIPITAEDEDEDSEMEDDQQGAASDKGKEKEGEIVDNDNGSQGVKPKAEPAPKRVKKEDKMLADREARIKDLEEQLKTERANSKADRETLEAVHAAYHQREKEFNDNVIKSNESAFKALGSFAGHR
ncbi:hypothetical protein BCR35DRAFT_326386 [Leucosporidium creatinivorum]|uniref:Myb-like domain-containing protein n=1 Tax=Leucosporidium creatinivorum TaxID=106004 RepID=A0A1Y2EDT4_9BASI|nr:hypothetical protein BCR35DRAFT_326386 [Leucosporidium creatinivorum]